MGGGAAFFAWQHLATAPERAPVLPDGCRDVLVLRPAGATPRVVLTEFDLRPRIAELAAGTLIEGFRLRPGAGVSPQVLAAIARDAAQGEGDGAAEILGNALSDPEGEDADVSAAIRVLAGPGESLASVARGLGVSPRSLQRRLRDRHLPPPDHWRLLGRARRAAGRLFGADPLAEIAAECGFADQAHMTREFVRWFGTSPERLRRNTALLDLACQPALGNWTGEQISTR
ncbi:AraC family transcriptional regulator [Stappia indica]|uniref:AraC family transcriptional regulator n=1 Tax=Stappia indica TaxID=538381 RepID=UPI001D1976F0|nr:helix-turn-helix domain-containing protein [Stappia indica]MCC4245446.1 helix-turn-helix domain-containing protein [Stappia indica]